MFKISASEALSIIHPQSLSLFHHIAIPLYMYPCPKRVEVNGGCLLVIDICTMLMLLLLPLTHSVLSLAKQVTPYGYHSSQKIRSALEVVVPLSKT